MDVISFSKAMKAKKAIQSVNDRLGAGVQDTYANVKARLEAIEAKDPHVTLSNRVSDVESVTVANLNKHNLRMNTVVNQNKYKLTDHSLDAFGDATGIDTAKSTGHQYDSTGKKVVIASGQTQAAVVTTPESVAADPTMIVVSLATNVKTQDTKVADLAGGVKTNVDVVNGQIQLHIVNSQATLGSLIQKMTAYNLPSPYVTSASSIYSGDDSWKAFDKNNTAGWWTLNTTSGWLKMDFGTAQVIKQYSVSPDTTGGMTWAPKNWTFEGSNDNTNFTVLDTQSNQINWTESEKRVFSIPNTTAYRYYRINVSTNVSASGCVSIGELDMMGDISSPLYSPSGSYESPVLDLGSNYKSFVKLDQVVNIPVAQYKLATPTMTSNTLPSGIASASGTWAAGEEAYKAFDQLSTTVWEVGATSGWIAYEFTVPKVIKKYALTDYAGSPGRMAKNWTLEGSNDGSSWTVLDTQTNQTGWQDNVKREYVISNTTAYKKYRINVSAINVPSEVMLAISSFDLLEPDVGSSVLTISTSTSTDGITFSPYAPLNTDGTIASPAGRYIKFKADMTGGSVMQNSMLNDFVAGESTQFQSDTQLLFDGSLHMKTAYSNVMVSDAAFTDAGSLLRKTIDKAAFKSIEKVEVK